MPTKILSICQIDRYKNYSYSIGPCGKKLRRKNYIKNLSMSLILKLKSKLVVKKTHQAREERKKSYKIVHLEEETEKERGGK